jgi:ubiquinone/menaquinone biosynthesis C-methylase UbiE
MFRRLIKSIHPEGIPWPGSLLYNKISRSRIFQKNYEAVAKDILTYSRAGRLLDIGTGPGWLLMHLARLSPELKLTGIDISPAMVKAAQINMHREGLSERVDIRIGQADALPFPKETFDTVVSTGSIHHWKNPFQSLNEVFRVVKPSGFGLIYDLVSNPPGSVLKAARSEFGNLRVALLWIHSFEEPFYSQNGFKKLPGDTLFKKGDIRFVGVQCCLVLNKVTMDQS